MATTQQALALQMIAQLRQLDPSASAEIGTPERKIIDTVAQSLFDSQIDLDALSSALDIDTKYGASLDRFLNLFSFTRQQATFATGFVTFSRDTASNYDIRVPANSTVTAAAATDGSEGSTDVQFTTLYDTLLPAGTLAVVTPVRASIAGASGNVAANRINSISNTPIFGITGVTNEVATSGGNDAETDDELKVRFKNTVFRNLAGTQDQYLALAVATAFTTRANVVGPVSNYREYMQVPPVDDFSGYDIDGDTDDDAGGGVANEYTTALSTLPFAKYIYATEMPVFVSSLDLGPGVVFYRQDIDFRINTSDVARNIGDAFRLANVGLGPVVASTPNTPNITFTNVYDAFGGGNPDITAIRPSDLVLVEYNYLSEASRNDVTLSITNAVDVYIDGGNDIPASTITTRPTTATAFVDNPNSKFHYENFRRVGGPEKRPLIGNVLQQLYWQPISGVPDQIIVGPETYFAGTHYWAISDTSAIGGTIRARDGIEWSTKVRGKLAGDPLGNPSLYTGRIITDNTGDPTEGQSVEVDSYLYDKNIVDLQASLEGSKQITTDVLAHKSKIRYFKLDVTVMYQNGVSISDTNNNISSTMGTYLQGLYFGAVVQLSDMLQVIHNVSGVDNVRWSSDTPGAADVARVFETDLNGNPLANVTIERYQPGSTSLPEIQAMFIGPMTGGHIDIASSSGSVSFTASDTLSHINSEIGSLFSPGAVTVTEDIRSTTGVRYPIRSFRITWTSNGAHPLLIGSARTVTPTTSPYIFDTDFFLRDDEQARIPALYTAPVIPLVALAPNASDTVPGLIIRSRAQNTFIRSQ